MGSDHPSPRPQPLGGLLGVLTGRSGDFVGDFEGAARLLGLGIASGADGTPDVDRRHRHLWPRDYAVPARLAPYEDPDARRIRDVVLREFP